MFAPWKKSYDQPKRHNKKQRHYFADKGSSSQSYGFSSSHEWMWELDYKESWTIKRAEHWRIDAFELWCWRRHLRVPWTARRSNQSILKEISPEYSLEGLMLKLKLHTLATWCRALLIWKDPDAGKNWRQEEKGTTEDEMAGWHNWLDGHEFEQAAGVGDGQGGLACCSPWGCKESDMTEWLNWTELKGKWLECFQQDKMKKMKVWIAWDKFEMMLQWVPFSFVFMGSRNSLKGKNTLVILPIKERSTSQRSNWENW